MVEDVDGNVYQTVKIGDQVWMAENLKVTKYRNGNPIFHIADAAKWAKTNDGAYCIYNNDSTLANTYGNLYNWYALNDSRNIAPEGWHIPTHKEIAELIRFLEGDTTAARKLKISGPEHWLNYNFSSNETKFSAKPGGYRFGGDGGFHTAGSNGYWWTTTQSFEMFAWSPRLYEGFADVNRESYYMNYGMAVRCIKDL